MVRSSGLMERVNNRNFILDDIYVKEKYVRDTLIVDKDGILLLVKDNRILYDKFGYKRGKNEVGLRFNFDKEYLIFKSSLREADIMVRKYLKDDIGCVVGEYCFEPQEEINEVILTRKELEDGFVFSDKKMDGLYVIDLKRGVLYANNEMDGSVVSDFVIPSDDEICELEYEFQKQNHRLFNLIRGYDDGIVDMKKKIEDIKYYPIVQGVYYHCQNYLYIKIQNGVFDIFFFEVVCMGKDKFKLVTRKVVLPKDNIISDTLESGYMRKKIM